MDTTSFTELLMFLRNNPEQKHRLSALLSEVDGSDAVRPSGSDDAEMMLLSEASALSRLSQQIISSLARERNWPYCHNSSKSQMARVHRRSFLDFMKQQRKNGYIPYAEAAELIGYGGEYIRKGVFRGYWHGQDGWVRQQDVIDHVMKHGNSSQRTALVTRLDALANAAPAKPETPVIRLRVEPRTDAQLELGLAAR
ncbi:MAG TPA: hypothetical protein PLB89_05320 [Flavobacteriales bacterium]|nr:hypothetical protein [Flavobacteriales bacterium]